MNTLKQFFPWILVALLAVLAVTFWFARDTTVVERVIPEKVGALAGPILPYPYFGFGGMVQWASARDTDLGLQQGTSTVCSLLSPVATSTLKSAWLVMHNATDTALVLEAGKSSNRPTATTTSFFGGVIKALAAQSHQSFSFSASTTPSSVQNDYFSTDPRWEFAPSTYFNFRVGGAAGDTDTDTGSKIPYRNYAPVGSCGAIWQQL